MDESTPMNSSTEAVHAWQEALTWFIRVREAPEDTLLRAGLERWLAQDQAHRKAYHKAQHVWLLTAAAQPLVPRDVGHAQTPPGGAPAGVVRGGALSGFRARHRQNRARPARLFAAITGVAASILLLVPSLQWGLSSDYHTGVGETRSVSLPDGSHVELNANSAISLTFGARQRGVRLITGEAFFEVAPDVKRPFTVNTSEADITVVGTAFDVREHGQSVAVRVQHGIVSVRDMRGAHAITLTAGSAATASRGQVTRTTGLAPEEVATWRSGRLIVDGATVEEVADALGDYHHGVILVSSSLKQQHLTGIYDLLHPEAALRSIAQSLGADFKTYTPYVLSLSAQRGGAGD